MRIAIVGGGAAGVVAAHLLDAHHDVVLFEAAPMLGGNIRTLGLNVPCPDPDLEAFHLDAGVIEFDAGFFPTVVRLFDRLGVPTTPVPATTTFLPSRGRRLLTPEAVRLDQPGPFRMLEAGVQMARFALAHRRFRQTIPRDPPTLAPLSMGELLTDDPFDRWAELLCMYAYSTPRAEVAQMPAGMVIPMLADFTQAERWFRIDGGVYRYVQAITAALRGVVRTQAPVAAIHRRTGTDRRHVRITVEGEAPEAFDAVVIATTPDRILPMLADPTDAELTRFSPWTGRDIHTLVHDDMGPYTRRGEDFATEFDVFEGDDGDGAYNALLDRLCDVHGMPDRHFGLAFHLDDEIDPAHVIHRQDHHVPVYTVPGFAQRAAVIADNGRDHTWFVGAWLGDGLHEGAVTSAARVAAALGGDVL